MIEGADLANAIDIHDRGAVHAHEPPGVEPLLQLGQSLPDEVRLHSDVQGCVIVGRSDPVDFIGVHDRDAIARADEKSSLHSSVIADECREPAVRFAEPRALLDAGEGARKTGILERLEQVVHGMHVELADGVLVVGGDEHDAGDRIRSDGLQNVEAVHFLHLHVEKEHIRRCLLDGRDGIGAAALARQLEIRAQQNADGIARQWLVIHDQSAQCPHATSVHGVQSEATTPSPRSTSSKRCASPYIW